MRKTAAKERKLFFLAAALVLVGAFLVSTPAEASRTHSPPITATLETSFSGTETLERIAGQTDDQAENRFRLFDDLSLPPHPLEWVLVRKTASGVFGLGIECNISQTGDLDRNCSSPSFQGLWTDPTTGLSYARNRWYDARTASWLSEDSLGAVDSPNLYAFVGWAPHMGRDPLGLEDQEDEDSGFNLFGFFIKPIADTMVWGFETSLRWRRTVDDLDTATERRGYDGVEDYLDRNPDASSLSSDRMAGVVRVSEDVKETGEAALRTGVSAVDSADRALLATSLTTATVRTTVGATRKLSDKSIRIVRRHLGGNTQLLTRGNRWNLPKGKTLSDIPLQDELGDEIQGMVSKHSANYSDAFLTQNELANINKELRKDNPRHYLIAKWKAQAKGRYVESRVNAELRKRHPDLQINAHGVDVINPETGIGYEVLSGTEGNIQTHATRPGMTDVLFRYLEY